jgi:hypothetical protein
VRRNQAPKPAALLHVIEARAYACMGDAQACRRALSVCQELFARAGDDTDPAWCAFFDENEPCGLIGVTLRDLALADPGHARRHAGEARPWIERAAGQRTGGFLRSKVLDLDGLAVTAMLLGEPDEAAALITSAISLAGDVTSARVISRLERTVALGGQLYPGSRAIAGAGREVSARTQGN